MATYQKEAVFVVSLTVQFKLFIIQTQVFVV